MHAQCRKFVIVMALACGAAAALAGETKGPIPLEKMSERQLRSQLEETRALNAQLESEHKKLQTDLAELEAQIAAKKQLLSAAEGSAAAARAKTPAPAKAPGNTPSPVPAAAPAGAPLIEALPWLKLPPMKDLSLESFLADPVTWLSSPLGIGLGVVLVLLLLMLSRGSRSRGRRR